MLMNSGGPMRSSFVTLLAGAAFAAGLMLLPQAGLVSFQTTAFAQEAPESGSNKAFIREDLESSATYLLGQLRTQKNNPARESAQSFLSEAQGLLGSDARAAYDRASSAIAANPDLGAAWLVFARAARTITPKDDSERYTLRDQALNAAYAAYTRLDDKDGEAEAVAIVAAIQSEQENWRGAINAYKASLDLKPDTDRQAVYDKLVEERGFRITNYTVDADSLTPRACVEFSEPLKAGVDFQSYVAVTGGAADIAVTPSGSQLCVDGLKHGTRYGLIVRQGVPSINENEVLRKNADYEFFVRDRAPAVRTTGKTYVLPRSGQQGLPLISVNTDKMAVDVYTIGDRSLMPTVQDGNFLNSIGSYSVEQLQNQSGSKVWSGTLDVKRVQNEDVTTAFPVMQAVTSLKPGVHVLVARPFVEKPEGSGDYADYYATQWFVVSDLGITAIKGNDGLHVMLRSVADASPSADVELRLLARNNEVLGTARTNANGVAVFDPGLAKGEGGLAPGLVVASTAGGDYGFLDLQQSSFDFTDRGVSGRTAPTGMDGFLYTERGVYRSGETVNVTALMRDPLGQAANGTPVTLIVSRPDGVEFKRQVVDDQGLGGRAFSFTLLGNAAPGSWSVSAYTDVKANAIGTTSFLVEDYVPERLDVKLAPAGATIRAGEPAEIAVDARYLYGAPGAALAVGGEYTIQTASSTGIPALEGYTVGLADEPFESVYNQIETDAETDENGKAVVSVELPEITATHPLEATFNLNVGESGGRAVTRQVRLPIAPKGMLIGVKRVDESQAGASSANFELVAVGADGTRTAITGVEWTISRIETNYQWFSRDGRWDYEVIKNERKAGNGVIDIAAAAPARISAPVEDYAQYRISVKKTGEETAETSFTFWNGWDGGGSATAPDRLELTLDSKEYTAGSVMKVRVAPRFAGKATLAVIGDKLDPVAFIDVPEGGTTVDIPVKAEWGAGAYLTAMAYRPLDAGNKRMPGRAVGLVWFDINPADRKIAVEIASEASIRPRGDLEIPVKLAGLPAGEEAYVTVAAVDIGILSLTGYTLPDPSSHYFGQRQLSAEMRDLYGYLIDGMQGEAGAIRSGGDAAAMNTAAIPPTQAPLARYSGVVKVNPDGTAKIVFDVPAFNGSVRVMAVAWSKGRTGQAQKDVIIRDPVVATGTLPRFLAIGDQSRFNIAIDNVEGAAGDYTLDLDVSGPITVPADALRKTVKLDKGGRTDVVVPVTAAGLGTATFDLRITGGGVDLTQSYTLKVQPSTQTIVRRSIQPLQANGGKMSITNDLLTELLPGSGSIAVSVAPIAALDVPALLTALDRYPYGCTEQTVSRALPLLYVNEIAARESLAADTNADQRIIAAIATVLARQDSSGSFGLWGVGGNDLWLDAFTADFLTRAREKKFEVPQRGFDMALDRLRNQVANASDINADTASGLAYAMYVLARNGRPVMGDLRYVADSKLAEVATPLAKAQIAAALSMLGDRSRAANVFNASVAALEAARDNGRSRPDYGSRLRDGVGVLTLIAENDADRGNLQKVASIVDDTRAAYRYTSTQEQSWMVLAAQAMSKEADKVALEVDGKPSKGAFYRIIREGALESGPVVISNTGASDAKVVLNVSGIPTSPEPAAEKGYKVERKLYRLDGKEAKPNEIRQNDRLAVVLTVTELTPTFARLLLVDPLPAGLEIDNPALVDGTTVGALDFVKLSVTPSNTEYRDDRFVAAFDRDSSQLASFQLAYTVRAVSPGTYVHPGAIVEDMYRPDLFGRSAFGTVTIAPAR
jgi:alpha-2-macroglobulin